MFSCPYGDRNDLPSKDALRKHVARHKKNTKPKERAEPIKIQDTKKITHPFSDEWDCAVCFHRFSSLEAAQNHYKTRHIDKIHYESKTEPNQKESVQVEKNPVNIQDLLNEMARRRAQELRQSLYAPQQGIVKQQLYSVEPQVEPIVESESEPKQERPNTEIDVKPQSPVIINALKNLFRGKDKNNSKQPEPSIERIYMSSRGVGVSGINVSISTQPYFCKTENRYLSWNEYLTCKTLGHEVIYANE
jgi:hypothetical protein